MTAMLYHMATSPNVKAVYPVASDHFKLQSIDQVKTKFAEVSKHLHPYIEKWENPLRDPIEEGDIKRTLTHIAKEAAANKDVILICGSFYIMSDVRNFLKYMDEIDPLEVNTY